MSIIHKTDSIISNSPLLILNTTWPSSTIGATEVLTNGTMNNRYETGLRALKTNTGQIDLTSSVITANQSLISTDGVTVSWNFISNQSKESVRVETTGNITIATALNSGDVINGVTLSNGDRVLVWKQTSAVENGIYIVSGSPSRSLDFAAGSSAASTYVFSQTTKSMYVCTTASGSDIVGTNTLTFEIATTFYTKSGDSVVRVNNYDRLINYLQAISSGIVNVSPGTYSLTSSITLLQGNDKIIQGSEGAIFQQSGISSILLRIPSSYSGIVIENITFDLNTAGVTAIDLQDCSDVTIKGCKFIGISGSSSEYIKLYTASIRITIIDCVFSMESTSKSAINFVGDSTDVIIDNCRLTNTTLSSVAITGSPANTIITNSFLANVNDSSLDEVIISGNYITATSGITKLQTGNTIITNNNIDACTNGIIATYSLLIASNTFTNNTTAAIDLSTTGSNYSLITGNGITATDRTDMITLDTNTDGNLISENTFNLSEDTDKFPITITSIASLNRLLRNVIPVYTDTTGTANYTSSNFYVPAGAGAKTMTAQNLPLNSHSYAILVYFVSASVSDSLDIVFTSVTTPLNGTSYTGFELTGSSYGFGKLSIEWTGSGWRQVDLGEFSQY